MSKFRCFRLKNRMLFANCISNLIGVLVTLFLFRSGEVRIPEVIHETTRNVDWFFMPAAFLTGFLFTVTYERPIRSYINFDYRRIRISDTLRLRARQGLLNEPLIHRRITD